MIAGSLGGKHMLRMFQSLAVACALFGAASAQATWREATSAHFVIYSNDTKEGDIRAFAERMERFDAAVRQLRAIPQAGSDLNKLVIYVVPTVSAIRKLYGAGDSSVAGFYAPRWTGSVAFVPATTWGGSSQWVLKPTTILLHEYTHHFFYRNYPGAYPAWFSEGYAEFHSSTDVKDDGSVLIGLPATYRADELAMTFRVPLSRLLAMGSYPKNPEDLAGLYAKGWLLTHFLTFKQDRAGQFEQYMKLLHDGTPPLAAAQKAFGDLNKLDVQIRAYASQSRLPVYNVPADKIAVGRITVRELGPGEAAMIDVHLRSQRGVNQTTAPKILADARRAAAPFPTDPAAQSWLAEAETDAGNYDEADAAEARALAADPHYQYALLYRAKTAEERAIHAKDQSSGSWNRVRALAIAANRNDPNAPGPLVLFYESFVEQKEKPSAIAVAGLERAYQLAPESMTLRLVLSREYLAEGRLPEARAALAPIAYDPHGGPTAVAATAILAKIDAGQREGLVEAANKAFESEQ